MDTSLDVMLVANAGLLLQYKGTTLLLDGIFDESGHPFDAPGDEMLEKMRQGEPPFERIDFLLFSHIHPDHCAPGLVQRLLQSRQVKGIFLPDESSAAVCALKQYLLDNDISCVYGQAGMHTYRLTPDITVQALPAQHLDSKYSHIRHFCLLISFGQAKYLFTADVDYTKESFAALQGTPLKAVFVNPLFFSALSRKRFFNGELQTQNICVYHVPSLERDLLHMRRCLHRDLNLWAESGPEVTILQDKYQRIRF